MKPAEIETATWLELQSGGMEVEGYRYGGVIHNLKKWTTSKHLLATQSLMQIPIIRHHEPPSSV